MTTPVDSGSVRVERNGEEIFVPGWISRYRGVSPENYLKELRKKAKPEHDYFVFSSHDPLHPEQSEVYVLVTDSKNLDGPQKTTGFRLFARNEVETITEIPNLRYVGWIDNRWDKPVQTIRVDSSSVELAEDFQEELEDRLEGKSASPTEIRQHVQEVLAEMGEDCWGIKNLEINPGETGTEIRLTVVPVPKRLVLHGLSDSIREEATAQKLPLSRKGFQQLIGWLMERHSREPGVFVFQWEVREDGVHVTALRGDQPQFVLLPEVVEELKREVGDFGEEAHLLEGGTTQWSEAEVRKFFERLEKRFRESGFELRTDLGEFKTRLADGRIAIIPAYSPLIRREKIFLSGDLDLPDIGGSEVVRRIFGDQPLNRAEVRERLAAVEDHYHRQNYLILGENLASLEGVQIPYHFGVDDVSIVIKVARVGRISVSGTIPQPNREALATALRLPGKEPFRIDRYDQFRSDARRAMIRLGLSEESAPTYVSHPDGTFDTILHVRPNDPMAGLEFGANENGPLARLTGSLPNRIPGLTQAGGSIGIGGDPIDGDLSEIGAQISAKSVPLTDGGIQLSGSLGAKMKDYRFYYSDGSLAEDGTLNLLNGSLMVHVPLGPSIAAPIVLRLGTHGAVTSRDGEKGSGEAVDVTNYTVGEVVGVGAIYDSVLTPNDLVEADLSVGLDHNLSREMGDTTLRASLDYKRPVGRLFTLEASLSGTKRIPAYGGQLPPERSIGPIDLRRIDFDRNLAEPYGSDHYWNTGLFWVLTYSRFVQPLIGATLAADGQGGLRPGAGIGLRIPLIGLTVYWSPMANRDLQNKWGIGIGIRGEY